MLNNKHIDPNFVKDKLHYNLFYKEAFILFSVLVAGKQSAVIMDKTNNLIDEIIEDERPDSLFNFIINKYSENNFEDLMDLLKKHKTGKYSLLEKFFKGIEESKINVSTCTLDELESLKGVGKKSSRFFMLYNRSDIQEVAVLDTHILKFLDKNGIEVPKQTPPPKVYDKLEKEYLFLAHKIEPRMTLADLDFLLWYNAKEYGKIPYIDENNELVF